MELTIEQALSQGVAAHNAGNLQEAERAYQAILQSQPKHPDANHNLGLISISVNQIEAALLLFKTALDVNPNVEQFWMSYIDALVKNNQLKDAKQAFEKSKNRGFDAKKLKVLLSQSKKLTATKSPSRELLNSLLEHYQNGRYTLAEKCAKTISQEFPNDSFSWKILGLLFMSTGRNIEALKANETAVVLSPQDAEAHSNLGNMLNELERLDDAVASYRQAIALNPDNAKVHYNLANTLKELGKLGEAEVSYTQAIVLLPDLAEAHANLGNTLRELGRLDEAEASYTQAIALKPDYAKAHSNLGITLTELGRLGEAEGSYIQAIALKPDYAHAHYYLSDCLSYINNLKKEICAWEKLLELDTDDFGLRGCVNLAICTFLAGDFVNSKKQVLAAQKIQQKTLSKFNNEKVYQRYLVKILKWHEDKYFDIDKGKKYKTLYVIGESHSLTSHHLRVQSPQFDFYCNAKLIKGCKQWDLGNTSRNKFKNKFESIFCSIPQYSYVLLAIGEIDCRLDSGIIKHINKYPTKQIKGIIRNTVENYLSYIIDNNSDCQHKIIIQGVPCPNIDIVNYLEKDVMQLIEVIKLFNFELKIMSEEKRFGFLDIRKLTDRGDGFSNKVWHIDSHHISPDAMIEAWSRFIY